LSRVSAWDWMGSLALLPVGYLIAGPLAGSFGARAVLGVGSAIGLILLLLGLLPRSTRELGAAASVSSTGRGRRSTQQVAREIRVEAGGEAQIAHVDPLVGAVHERR